MTKHIYVIVDNSRTTAGLLLSMVKLLQIGGKLLQISLAIKYGFHSFRNDNFLVPLIL